MKITDFGIAKAVDAAPVTRSGMVMGTAHYIAPEQAGGGDAGPARDVYSLGVVGYECLAGRRPYLSENAVTVAMMHIRDPLPPLPNDVPPVVRQLIEATLAKDPRQRYATGGEFAQAVAAVRRGEPLPAARCAAPRRPIDETGRPCTRRAAPSTARRGVAEPAPSRVADLAPPEPPAARRPAGPGGRGRRAPVALLRSPRCSAVITGGDLGPAARAPPRPSPDGGVLDDQPRPTDDPDVARHDEPGRGRLGPRRLRRAAGGGARAPCRTSD